MGVGIRYGKQVPGTLYRFAFVNFEDEIFVLLGGEDVTPSTNELNRQ